MNAPTPWTPSGWSRPSLRWPESPPVSSGRTDPSGWWSASGPARCSTSGCHPPSARQGSCLLRHWANVHPWVTFSANIVPSCWEVTERASERASLCSRGALGGEGRRRTAARVQSTSVVFRGGRGKGWDVSGDASLKLNLEPQMGVKYLIYENK